MPWGRGWLAEAGGSGTEGGVRSFVRNGVVSAPQPSGDGCGAVLSTRERRVREERGRVGNPPPRPAPGGSPPVKGPAPGGPTFH